MYKLLLVEDEADIRDGLSQLEWGAFQLELCGAYMHGMEALEHMSRDQVDVIITDLHMPILGGLELAEQVARLYPLTKVIVLTGYHDFHYVRSSFRNGVIDYLLKPIQLEALAKSVSHAVQSLESERAKQMRAEELIGRSKRQFIALRNSFFRKALFEALPQEEWEEGVNIGELWLSSPSMCVAVMKLDEFTSNQQERDEKERKLILFALTNLITELWDEERDGYFYIDPYTLNIYLLAKKIQSELMETLCQLREQLYKFHGLFRTTISIGIGGTLSDYRELRLSTESAMRVLEQCPHNGVQVAEDSDMASVERSKSPARSVEANEHKAASPEHSLHIIRAAKAYIEHNFQRSITLQEVSEQVHVSPVYLSILFKETTGQNYIHFLSECRIAKAKELLKDPRYKVYEVGEMVGYENPRYFSELFKRYTDKTPHEYRSTTS